MSGYWHGGPRIEGDWVLPADQLPGCISTRSVVPDDDPFAADVDALYDGSKVYVVNNRTAALIFAAGNRSPWIYEVEPLGPLEADPDFTPGQDSLVLSYTCDRARIVRRFKPSSADVSLARAALFEVPT